MAKPKNPATSDPAAQLAREIRGSSADKPVKTTLETDARVLARVTDGIYRQPGSALRELISNAFDADATRVVIQTDRPRFDRITIEDNGVGMSTDALAHLLKHIGGSAKRSQIGSELGITNAANPRLSPTRNRNLIGKIGIGLFSVAQLAQRFQIITKTEGAKHRTVATVVLRQFSEDAPVVRTDERGTELRDTGEVLIWEEPATDLDVHGTTIVLTDMRPQTKDTLASRELWSAIEDHKATPDEAVDLEEPQFHIGRFTRDGSNLHADGPRYDRLPWTPADAPTAAFRALVNVVAKTAESGRHTNPRLETIFDYYLRMVWQLSLSIPAPYIDGHPFDLTKNDAYTYVIPQARKPGAQSVQLKRGQTLRDACGLAPVNNDEDEFVVIIDDLQLARPLRFRNLPTTSHQLKKPIMFVAHCREEFSGADPEFRGGPLEFQAYLFWTPKIVPTEHQGVLLRVHGSSGTVFDPSFLRYQVAEQNRLRQTTCESS